MELIFNLEGRRRYWINQYNKIHLCQMVVCAREPTQKGRKGEAAVELNFQSCHQGRDHLSQDGEVKKRAVYLPGGNALCYYCRSTGQKDMHHSEKENVNNSISGDNEGDVFGSKTFVEYCKSCHVSHFPHCSWERPTQKRHFEWLLIKVRAVLFGRWQPRNGCAVKSWRFPGAWHDARRHLNITQKENETPRGFTLS